LSRIGTLIIFLSCFENTFHIFCEGNQQIVRRSWR